MHKFHLQIPEYEIFVDSLTQSNFKSTKISFEHNKWKVHLKFFQEYNLCNPIKLQYKYILLYKKIVT